MFAFHGEGQAKNGVSQESVLCFTLFHNIFINDFEKGVNRELAGCSRYKIMPGSQIQS